MDISSSSSSKGKGSSETVGVDISLGTDVCLVVTEVDTGVNDVHAVPVPEAAVVVVEADVHTVEVDVCVGYVVWVL